MLIATLYTGEPHTKSGYTPNYTSFIMAFSKLQFFKYAEVKLTPVKSAPLKSEPLSIALNRFASGMRTPLHFCFVRGIPAAFRIVTAFEAAYYISETVFDMLVIAKRFPLNF